MTLTTSISPNAPACFSLTGALASASPSLPVMASFAFLFSIHLPCSGPAATLPMPAVLFPFSIPLHFPFRTVSPLLHADRFLYPYHADRFLYPHHPQDGSVLGIVVQCGFSYSCVHFLIVMPNIVSEDETGLPPPPFPAAAPPRLQDSLMNCTCPARGKSSNKSLTVDSKAQEEVSLQARGFSY